MFNKWISLIFLLLFFFIFFILIIWVCKDLFFWGNIDFFLVTLLSFLDFGGIKVEQIKRRIRIYLRIYSFLKFTILLLEFKAIWEFFNHIGSCAISILRLADLKITIIIIDSNSPNAMITKHKLLDLFPMMTLFSHKVIIH